MIIPKTKIMIIIQKIKKIKTKIRKYFPEFFHLDETKNLDGQLKKKQRREFQRALPLVLNYLKKQILLSSSSSSFPEKENNKEKENKEEEEEERLLLNRPIIIISQLDLDEIPTRETLIYWKHCTTVPPSSTSSSSNLISSSSSSSQIAEKYSEKKNNETDLHLRVIWLRYHLECQQESSHSKFYSTIWRSPKNLYQLLTSSSSSSQNNNNNNMKEIK